MILVDTSIWIDHLRGGSDLLARLLERDRLSLNRGAFPKRRESDSTCWLLIGSQLGWLEPILWTCGSGWLGLWRRAQTCRSVAKTFMRQRRQRCEVVATMRPRPVGSPAALKMGGHRPLPCGAREGLGLARIAEKPDLTLRALLKELADRGWWSAIMRSGIFFTMKACTFQKSLRASEQDPAGRRQGGVSRPFRASGDDRSEAARVHPDRIFVKTNMTRTHGRCASERLSSPAPAGRWRTLTFLAALRCDGLYRAYASSTDRSMAQAALMSSRFSSGSSRQSDIVVIGQPPEVLKGRAVHRRHPRGQSQLLFLPAYSPEPQSD